MSTVDEVLIVTMIVGAALAALVGYVVAGRLTPAPERRRSKTAPAVSPLEPGPGIALLPPNTVQIAGRGYLRVRTPDRTVLHLAAGVTRDGRPASSGRDGQRGLDQLSDYDAGWLLAPAWTRRTLCGLGWDRMADHRAEVDLLIARLGAGAMKGYICPYCAATVSERRAAG